MADGTPTAGFLRSRPALVVAAVLLLGVGGLVIWWMTTAGRESTDDAQVDAHVTQIAARVGGTVLRVHVNDNQSVKSGAVLVEIDPRDYQVAVEKARAELADAEAAAIAARSNVPVTSAATASGVTAARSGVTQAESGIQEAERGVDASRARLGAMQARLREVEASATKANRDVERYKGLLAKDEVSQQQFDAAVAASDAQRAAVDSAKAQVAEAEAGIKVAENRLTQAHATQQQAQAALTSAQTAPEQVTATQARARSADARVQQTRAALAQAELNLEYATLKAPANGFVSRKTVEVGQVVQAGQPLMAVIALDEVWVTANFKETQLTNMRPGQRASITVDAYGGREYKGHVDSIAAATGARFSLLPPENATGNFVKVVQRVPVKIVLDPGQDPEHALRPGLSVVPTVYTK